ncbi:hypothetical protein NONO_c09250 [Nocardia nova SH22a]|uniref:WXG100 family type VII secretion target n=1 Tax=Nocardia nova SH22a TaxID=1415166 RepID=W5T932_9NOCA|nr:hypothetical protein [Nocardia nova]AHH15732.1 hypothetical protein NONO_c09250 [Nocardia nova SH22a]
MANEIEVEVAKLRTAAGKTQDVRDHIEQVLTRLHGKTSGYGNCWGDDTLGEQFAGTGEGDGYLAAAENMVTGARGFADAFQKVSTGQTDSATYLETMEHGNTDGFR